MKSLIMALLLCCVFAQAQKFDENSVRQMASQIDYGGLNALAPKVDETIAAIIKRSADSLRDQGYKEDADRIETEFRQKYYGYVEANLTKRHQGDHKPFLEF